MTMLSNQVLGTSVYVTAAFGLVGALVGGLITLLVAWHARKAAERAWVRDSRREIYTRFLTNAQRLLIACEADAGKDALESAHSDFFEAYAVVQTVAERRVVDAARVHAYRLLWLTEIARGGSILPPDSLARVAELVRLARHDTIDAMRDDLGLHDSARPPKGFNPFLGTEFEQAYAATDHEPAA
jgi:hypothetical protein